MLAKCIKQYTVDVIALLKKRIAELEPRPAVIYLGVHKPGKKYSPGSMVTAGGSVWHCEREMTATPNGTSADWVLAVEHGQDAKATPR